MRSGSDSRAQNHRIPSHGRRQSLSRRLLSPAWLSLAALLFLSAFLSAPAFAEVKLRVEARPITDPINVFVTVTNGGGNPVGGLTSKDFTVLVDGVEVLSPTFSLSPVQDAEQQVSVVFAMDYSNSTVSAQPAMEQAVLAFLDAMVVGDYAAIIKFNETNPERVGVLQSFIELDGPGGTNTSLLKGAVTTPYIGSGSPVIDAVEVAVRQFVNAPVPLPPGPKVVILVSDGGDNSSTFKGSDVVGDALKQGISLFSIGVGPLDQLVSGREITGAQLLQQLAFETGGQYYEAPDDQAIEEAYGTIAKLLQNEYLLSFASNITDCNVHVAEVRVTGFDPATSTFTRCTAPGSSTPPPQGDVGGTPLPDDTGQTSRKGGGAFGPLGLIAGLSLVALRRRLRVA